MFQGSNSTWIYGEKIWWFQNFNILSCTVPYTLYIHKNIGKKIFIIHILKKYTLHIQFDSWIFCLLQNADFYRLVFSFSRSLIFNNFLMDLLKDYRWNPLISNLNGIFTFLIKLEEWYFHTLEEKSYPNILVNHLSPWDWKFHSLPLKEVNMPHFYPA